MQDFMKRCVPVFEVSSESNISGRRPIKVVLHEIHPDTEHYQDNGISWNEEYTMNNLVSVVGMSIVAEFINDERDMPYGHGLTEIRDNMPIFEDATMVGHFHKAYIDDVMVEGELKRVLVAEGTLDEMRYPNFVNWVKEQMADTGVKGSVEIVGKPEHDKHIIYSGGWKEKGRVPQIYDYSGYAILSVKPADNSAIVMELNNNTKAMDKEENPMDEKMIAEIKSSVAQAVAESNAKNAEFQEKIDELNAQVAQLQGDLDGKNAEIAQLNEKLTQYEADIQDKDAKLSEVNTQIEQMKNEKAVADLNAALEAYTEEQREIAKEEIEAYKANPDAAEINSIVGKICTEMVRKAREEHVAEQNAMIDVFSMVEETKPEEDQGAEVNVF